MASRRATGSARGGFDTLLVVLGAIMLVYVALPVLALLGAQRPGALLRAIDDPLVLRAAVTTLLTATVSTLLVTTFGVPLGWWLARTDWSGARFVMALVVFPLVLPPVVSGTLLLAVFGGGGLAGSAGVAIDGTLAGVVAAQTFVAAPFVVLTARSAIASVDPTVVEAARTLGAGDLRTFVRVVLPLSWRGILAGITLAFARAAGEFGATLMLAYHPRTLPVEIWRSFSDGGLAAAFPVAMILVVLALTALGVLRTVGGGGGWWRVDFDS